MGSIRTQAQFEQQVAEMSQSKESAGSQTGVVTSANGQYNSTFAGKGAVIADTKLILQELARGKDIDTVRQMVTEDDLLDRRTLKDRLTVWKEVFRRFLSGRDAKHIFTLAHMVSDNSVPTITNLVLFYEYCQVDQLLYDLTVYCTYALFQNARVGINQVDLNEWLSTQEANHPEISGWSLATRNRLVGSYLATIRDFGLVTGVKTKEFHKLYVPREAFVYALYHQKDRGIEGKALIQSIDWRLFLLSEGEVIAMLDDAARGGFVNFRRAGDIFDLRFVYNDLHEVVNAIVS